MPSSRASRPSFITPDCGKLTAIAKGVRKTKSKLAGGLQLMSVSHLTILKGRGEIDTIMSTRLLQHFSGIVKDLRRTETAYNLIKLTDKNTEQSAEAGFYELLKDGLEALDDGIDTGLVNLWFGLRLLKLTGHAPNLQSDVGGNKLAESASYDFQAEGMHFVPLEARQGKYLSTQIKFLRLVLAADSPAVLRRVQSGQKHAQTTQSLVHLMLSRYLRQ
jgi:DNA repair protein RecO (recombination protein O)